MEDIFSKREIVTSSIEETQRFASELLGSLSGRNVIALRGDLGSGKTTFSQGIGKALGIKRHLQSPTFTIIKQYQLGEKFSFLDLYHIDLYRLEGDIDINQLGLSEIMSDVKNLVLIEWAEKIEDKLPRKRIEISFEYVDEEKRRIKIKKL